MKIRAAAAIALCALLLSGCGDGGLISGYRDIASLLTVQAVGIDYSENGVILSVCASGGEENKPSLSLSCSAPTLAAAQEKLQSYAGGRELFYGHAAYYVLGESVLWDGVGTVLDGIERNEALRLNTSVFAVPDGSAQDLLLASGGDEGAAKLLSALVERSRKTGGPVIFTALELAAAFDENGAGLVCAVKGSPSDEAYPDAEGELAIVPDGYIIINKGETAGRIPEEESGAVSLLLGRARTETVTLGGTELRLEETRHGVSPVFGDAGLSGLEVSVKLSAALLETDGKAKLDELETRLADEVREDVLSVLRRSREAHCDFLHLGAALEMREGERLRGAGESLGAVLGGMELSVSVTAEITHSFLIDLGKEAQT